MLVETLHVTSLQALIPSDYCQGWGLPAPTIGNTADCRFMKYSISPRSQEGAMPCAPTYVLD
jgi:hypothetical protein